MRTAIPLSFLFLALPACGVPALDALQEDLDAQGTDGSTTTTTSSGSGGSSGPISTVTSDSGGGSTTSDTDGATSEADTTSADPAAPPTIADYTLDPATIEVAGPTEVTIWADAEGVRMSLEDGSVAELTPTEPGVFSGEILARTGLDNGDHHAIFAPWRADLEGAEVVAPYTLDLPEAGSEAFWGVDYENGSGLVAAVGVLPGGDGLELGTLLTKDGSSCYLRRRSKDAGWDAGDFVEVLPKCKAVDLEVDDEGAIYLLVQGEADAGGLWWLAKKPAWGAPLKSIAYGAKDEVAHALALSPIEGKLAVCGSAPTVEPGDLDDAMVRVFQPDFTEQSKKTFDYVKNLSHAFDEEALGCDYLDEDRIIVVGKVFGMHSEFDPKRDHRFDVVFDLAANHGDLRVATAGLVTQSVASDVDVDDAGRAWVVGYVCNDVCKPEGQLWMLDAEGDLAVSTSLGVHSSEALAPSRVRWSPAGYAVVASGGLEGHDAAFTLRAYAPLKAEPVWAFVREDVGLLHVAHALAIGRYGEVYTGGFGANGYPLFVIAYG